MNYYALGASFLGTGVEFVEVLTIILAVGAIRGWKSALAGAATAVVALAVLVVIIGAPLVKVVHIGWVQLVIGILMLLFGIRWLRKAILRYSGLKALHDESQAYEEEVNRQRSAGDVSNGIDPFAFSTTFSGTFLEGLEAIFIVITFGFSQHAIESSIYGAALATIVVLILGIAFRSPLSQIPENTLKFIVGVMLTSFGAFWIGEGIGVHWPQADLSLVYIIATLLMYSWLQVTSLRSRLRTHYTSHSVSVGLHR